MTIPTNNIIDKYTNCHYEPRKYKCVVRMTAMVASFFVTWFIRVRVTGGMIWCLTIISVSITVIRFIANFWCLSIWPEKIFSIAAQRIFYFYGIVWWPTDNFFTICIVTKSNSILDIQINKSYTSGAFKIILHKHNSKTWSDSHKSGLLISFISENPA